MKKKRKRIINILLSIILCITMVIPSFVSFADGGSDTNRVGDADSIPPNSTGVGNSLRGTNIVVSLISVENTTAPYRNQIDAHNAGSTDTWSEMSVAIVDNHLKDFPDEFLNEDILKQGAVIRYTIFKECQKCKEEVKQWLILFLEIQVLNRLKS